jgi:hypothetical protein
MKPNPDLIMNRRVLLSAIIASQALPEILAVQSAQAQSVPLASWNDGAAKQTILDFLRVTTDQASAGYIPPEARIALSTKTARCGSNIPCIHR